MKKKISAVQRKLVAFAVVLMMVLTMAVPAAFAANEKVTNDINGVFTIEYSYKDTNGDYYWLKRGSGFLINEDTLLTCYHVVHIVNSDTIKVDDEEVPMREFMSTAYGKDWERNMAIRIVYQNGSAYTAKEINEIKNEANDFTAVKISEGSINNRTILPINSDGVQKTDQIYALGFPAVVAEAEDTLSKTSTPGDVTIKEGKISKEAVAIGGVNYLNHDAELTGGMSGGPLVNENGEVIGINAASINGSYNYAINISQVVSALETTGTKFTVGNPEPDQEQESDQELTPEDNQEVALDTSALDSALLQAQSILNDSDNYDADKITALQTAVDEGNAAKKDATEQTEIDTAAEKINTAITNAGEPKKQINMLPIIIGVVIALIVIIIIVIVVVSRKGKKKEEEPSTFTQANPQMGGFNQQQPVPAQSFSTMPSGDSQMTDILAGGSEKTGILNEGSTPTTVLSSKPYGILTRKNNGQSIQISAQTFIIGKERRKVTYCVENNTMISRTHAQIVKNGNGAAIMDMNSKNGTFVNGIKCAPNDMVSLKDGDTIQLADEEFTFRTM